MRARLLAIAALCALACAACEYRPARFADRPVVGAVSDDAPIHVPRRRTLSEPVYLAEIYFRRPITDALDAERFPQAGDVNAADEVPPSSWYEPNPVEPAAIAQRPGGDGAPVPPLNVLGDAAVAVSSGFSVEDARGLRYELRPDTGDRPEMRTAAVAIASRLVWGTGLRTPEVTVARVAVDDFTVGPLAHRDDGTLVDFEAILRSGPPPKDGRFRVAAVRWPAGIDVGPAPIATVRFDDPNDRVPHRDRRTLRALKAIGAWLQIAGLGPEKTLDAYVGRPGEGHLEHFVTGLDDALGADDVVAPGPPDKERGASALLNFLTLGFARSPAPEPTSRKWLALGAFDADVSPGTFGPSMPYEPIDRTLDTDGYWGAKRIAELSHDAIVAAVAGGEITDAGAREHLVSVLEARRAKVVQHWMGRVTPLEIERVGRGWLTLRDDAIFHGFARAERTRYTIHLMNEHGTEVGPVTLVRATGARLTVQVPVDLVRATDDYLVVRVVGERDGVSLPRGFEVHVAEGSARFRVLGVRH